jgi:pimeloyl-ACP methyl ester carboxylesterase
MRRANGAAIIAMGGPGGALGNNLPPVGFLLKEGFGVLQVDSRACAQPAARVTLGADELLDAEAALRFLKSQPDVQYIGMIGFSMGGVTAIRTAARHKEIEAVVAEGGYFNLGKDITDADRIIPWVERAFLYLVVDAFHLQTGVDPFAVSPEDDLPMISPRPVLLIYGSQEIDSGRGKLQYRVAREPKQLWVVEGGKHGTNYAIAGDQYKQRVLGLFTQYLVR